MGPGRLIYISLASLFLSGCSLFGRDCTSLDHPAVATTVFDAVNGAPIGAYTLILTGAGYDSVIATGVGDQGNTVHAGHSAGHYHVRVSSKGYLDFSDDVLVPSDGCHAVTTDIHVRLQPATAP